MEGRKMEGEKDYSQREVGSGLPCSRRAGLSSHLLKFFYLPSFYLPQSDFFARGSVLQGGAGKAAAGRGGTPTQDPGFFRMGVDLSSSDIRGCETRNLQLPPAGLA